AGGLGTWLVGWLVGRRAGLASGRWRTGKLTRLRSRPCGGNALRDRALECVLGRGVRSRLTRRGARWNGTGFLHDEHLLRPLGSRSRFGRLWCRGAGIVGCCLRVALRRGLGGVHVILGPVLRSTVQILHI